MLWWCTRTRRVLLCLQCFTTPTEQNTQIQFNNYQDAKDSEKFMQNTCTEKQPVKQSSTKVKREYVSVFWGEGHVVPYFWHGVDGCFGLWSLHRVDNSITWVTGKWLPWKAQGKPGSNDCHLCTVVQICEKKPQPNHVWVGPWVCFLELFLSQNESLQRRANTQMIRIHHTFWTSSVISHTWSTFINIWVCSCYSCEIKLAWAWGYQQAVAAHHTSSELTFHLNWLRI